MKLTAKQQQFIHEYLIDLNGKQAAIRAGYSPKTADVIACQNLIKLRTEIEQAKAERVARAKVNADEILVFLSSAMRADIAEIQNDDGTFKPLSQWPLIWRQMAEGHDVDREDLKERSHDGVQADKDRSWDTIGTVTKMKYKFMPKSKIVELAMRHTQVNALALPKEEPKQINIHIEIEDRLTRAREYLANSRTLIEAGPTRDRLS
jgi:phage terminase small subunit